MRADGRQDEVLGGIVQAVAWGLRGALEETGWVCGKSIWVLLPLRVKEWTLLVRDAQKRWSFFFLQMRLSRNPKCDIHSVTSGETV